MFVVNYNNFNHLQKCCLVSLLLFPTNSIIKKREIVFWWFRALDDLCVEEVFVEL
ncbi:hypothetical protein Fmac_026847 [Flemingia macrophylla]|uniref:Uncharacterized protein n=1 Tax=Flemingia macrophylla TaxID=520843 RepID=A0ABD1LFZ9_9FABA